jgi:transcriptional antiterminator RfaH
MTQVLNAIQPLNTMIPESPNWYLVQCKPRECERALFNLEQQDITAFLPMGDVQRRKARQVFWRNEPLFPYYLFVKMSLHSAWSKLRSTRGVAKLVRFQELPVPVDDNIVQALQQQCAGELTAPKQSLFRPGQSVMIEEGCFRELEAIVKCTKGDERVVLLLNFLNKQQKIELPAAALKPL